MTQVYLEVTIGDFENHKNLTKQYELGLEFLKAKAKWVYDEGEDINGVKVFNEEQVATLSSMVQSDPSYKDKGELIFNQPEPLPKRKLVFELHSDCPKASDNFKHLCLGDKGLSKSAKKPLHFLNTKCFRLVPNYILQGGDVTRGDGSGGDSIYNGKFNDEKPGLKKEFDRFGLLAMANSGKNSNTSQFFITLPKPNTSSPAEIQQHFAKLKGKYVVFGHLINPIEDLNIFNDIPVNGETPKTEITISDSGLVN